MPVIAEKNISPSTRIGIWEVQESLDELVSAFDAFDGDKKILDSFTHSFRKSQWLAVRLLLHALVPGEKIRYDDDGKPWPKNTEHFISVSHSGPLVAIMLSDLPCGIDIEHIRPKIDRIAPRFLSEAELRSAMTEPVTERLHVYWCVKEAAYKMNGRKNVSMRSDIFVEGLTDISSGKANVTLRSADILHKATANFERRGEYMLAWVLNNVQ
ncbi:MAG TPA: 4'-phosphopantetheinyl transferase superfamily protein [Bacteroidia bacterium]|jgi:hypothetical protein|nr:4'-phosphopantetheinyl transferase superfamily protein [Bacteroidia bacterium]